jgi:quinol monooxygenase YgiN
MIVVLHFRPDAERGVDDELFLSQAHAALTVLAERAGFVRASLGRATDDGSAWVLVSEWESVGAYRRALGGYQVKLVATPFLAQAIDQPSAYEALLTMGTDGVAQRHASDRAADADWVQRWPGGPPGVAQTP